MELISRQAAINALNEYFARIGKLKRRGLTEGEKAISLDTVGAIKTLPHSQPEPQWIPCNWHTEKENLPQECKSVLICMKDNYGYRIGVSYRADYNRWEGFGRANVIAWMPLPEPYKERQEE